MLWRLADSVDGDFWRLHGQGPLAAVADARVRQPFRMVGEKLRVVHPLNDLGLSADESGRAHNAVPETQRGVAFKRVGSRARKTHRNAEPSQVSVAL